MTTHRAEDTISGALRFSRVLVVLGAFVLACATAPAWAQPPTVKPNQPDPVALGQAMSQMGPMYEAMMQAMMDGSLKALERPENVERLAVFMRRYYETLIKQGFSKDEALQILAGIGVPFKMGR